MHLVHVSPTCSSRGGAVCTMHQNIHACGEEYTDVHNDHVCVSCGTNRVSGVTRVSHPPNVLIRCRKVVTIEGVAVFNLVRERMIAFDRMNVSPCRGCTNQEVPRSYQESYLYWSSLGLLKYATV